MGGISGWTIAQIVLALVSVAATLLNKPKAPKQSNNVQRQGVDNGLQRLYGTRRLFMVVTDITANGRQFGMNGSNLTKSPDVWSPLRKLEGLRETNKPYCLHFQGAICVSGRLNAAINQNTRDRKDLKCEVDGRPYDDIALVSHGENFYPGNCWALYLQGGATGLEPNIPAHDSRDYYAELVGVKQTEDKRVYPKMGAPSDAWTGLVHGSMTAYLRIEKNVTYAGIPEISWLLTSNPLWDPREDPTAENVYKPDTWTHNTSTGTGRPDNPVLQLLDYMLDKQYGAGIDIKEFELESWKAMADIADIPVGVTTINEIQTDSTYSYNYKDFDDNIQEVVDSTIDIQNRANVRPLLVSNLLIETEDDLASNIEELLAACRGARLFKNRDGKWKIQAAWLLEKDCEFVVPAQGNNNAYSLPFVSDQVAIYRNNAGNPEGPWTLIPANQYTLYLDSSSSEVGAKILPFKTATYTRTPDRRLTINFANGAAPEVEIDKMYTLQKVKNSNVKSLVTFVGGEATIDNNGTRWLVTGIFRQEPGDDVSYNDSGSDLKESDPYDAAQIGVTFNSPIYSPTLIKFDYPTSVSHGLTIAAHIVRTQTDIGLDYDTYVDPDGILIIPLNFSEVEYLSVTTDEKLNQCIVKYPDEFLKYKVNEIEWPETDSQQHIDLLEADNYRPLTKNVSINSITDKATALDYAEFTVRQSRSIDTIQMVLGSLALVLEPNDIVKISDPGINVGNPETPEDYSYYWRVISLKVNPDLTVQVSLVRYEAEDYTFISKYLADKKYTAVLAPIPVVTFGQDPVKVFTNQMAGFGTLTWIPPEWNSEALNYYVSYSRQDIWEPEPTYVVNSIVLNPTDYIHYRCITANTGVPPHTNSSLWASLDNTDGIFWEFIGDTTADTIVIPNMPESRSYTFQVQVSIPVRGLGSGAYYSYYVESFNPAFAANLRIDILFPYQALPQDPQVPGIPGVDLSNSENAVVLYAGNERLPISGGPAPPPDFDSCPPGTWYVESYEVSPENAVVLKDPPFRQIPNTGGTTVDHAFIEELQELLLLSGTYNGTIHLVYKSVGGVRYDIFGGIQYVVSTQGADGIDGGTVAQLSIFRQFGENYDGNGNIIPPPPPGNGSFNWATNTLTAPTGWYPFQNTLWGDGTVWTSSVIKSKTQGSDTSVIAANEWSTPDLIATFGGSTVRMTLYRRSNDPLDDGDKPPNNDLWFDFASSQILLNGIALPPDYPWQPVLQAGTEEIWVIQCTFTIPAALGIDKTSEWTDPTILGISGRSIYNGIMFQRVAKGANPTNKPPNNIIGYNFGDEWYELTANPGVPITQYNGWSVEAPPQGDGAVLWAIRETFSVQGGYGTDNTSTWSNPEVYVADGEDGLSSYQWMVYKKLSDGNVPGTPVGGSWNFDDPEDYVLPTGGWSIRPPSMLDATDVIWVSITLATSPDPKGVDNTLTWSAPSILTLNGKDGRSTEIVFKRSVSEPSKPGDSAGIPVGWYDLVSQVPPPTSANDVIWQSTGTRETANANWIWNKPVQLEAGAIAAEVALYKRFTGTPTLPGTVSYDFSTNSFGGSIPNNGWYSNVPASDGNPAWMIKTTVVGKNASSIVSVAPAKWTAPSLVFTDGDPGEDGLPGDPGADGNSINIIYRLDVDRPATPPPSATVPNGWYDDTANVPPPNSASQVLWASNGIQQSGPGSNYVWKKPYQLGSGQVYAEVSVWQRKSTAPTAKPATDGFKYNFVTKALETGSGSQNGWSSTIPGGTDPMYTCRATAIGTNEFSLYSLLNTDWSAIAKAWQDGATGSPGGPGVPGTGGVVGNIKTSSANVLVKWDGTFVDSVYGGTSNEITVNQGGTSLLFGTNSTATPTTLNRFNISKTTTSTLTVPSFTGANTATASHAACSNMTSNNSITSVTVDYVVRYRTNDNITGFFNFQMTLTKVAQGTSGFVYLFRQTFEAPSAAEIPFPADGQVAIIENTARTQAAFIWKGGIWVSQELFNTGVIMADAIKASQLEISSNPGVNNGARIYFNSSAGSDAQNRISIFDLSNVERVKIGKLN